MPEPSISPLPPAPSRADAPALFISRADAFVGALGTLVSQVNDVITWIADTVAANAATVAAAVQATGVNLAAQAALLATAGFSGTSTTQRAIGTGSKAFVIQPNRSFVPGSAIQIAATASPSVNYMLGVVTAYNKDTGDLTADVYDTFGSGMFSDWTISFGGVRGKVGPAVSQAFISTSQASQAFAPGNKYRLTARITAGTLPASPGLGGDPIEIESAIDARTNFHTITPNGTETVTVDGTAGSPLYMDVAFGQIIKLIPIAGGWEQGT